MNKWWPSTFNEIYASSDLNWLIYRSNTFQWGLGEHAISLQIIWSVVMRTTSLLLKALKAVRATIANIYRVNITWVSVTVTPIRWHWGTAERRVLELDVLPRTEVGCGNSIQNIVMNSIKVTKYSSCKVHFADLLRYMRLFHGADSLTFDQSGLWTLSCTCISNPSDSCPLNLVVICSNRIFSAFW